VGKDGFELVRDGGEAAPVMDHRRAEGGFDLAEECEAFALAFGGGEIGADHGNGIRFCRTRQGGEFPVAEGVAVGVAVEDGMPVEAGHACGDARMGIGRVCAYDTVELGVERLRVDFLGGRFPCDKQRVFRGDPHVIALAPARPGDPVIAHGAARRVEQDFTAPPMERGIRAERLQAAVADRRGDGDTKRLGGGHQGEGGVRAEVVLDDQVRPPTTMDVKPAAPTVSRYFRVHSGPWSSMMM